MSMIWAGFALLLVFAAASDAARYTIPNWISAALVLLFGLTAIAGPAPVASYWDHLVVFAVVFGLGFALFQWTGMGGGDAKLAAAIGLWGGLAGLQALMLWLAVSMAVLVIALVALRRIPMLANDRAPRVLQVGAPAPLGVALAAAAVLASQSFETALWFV